MVSQASWLLFLGLVGSTFTIDPLKLKDTTLQQESYIDQCTPVPTWSIHGERVVNLVGENITVIALLNSSRLFGRQQAGMLNLLQNRLYQAGFSSINFIVVDATLTTEKSQLLRIELQNIPVHREQPQQPVLGAGHDQVLVLDKCGRIAYQVITPFSKLTHPYVKAAILSTYTDNPCGTCNQTRKVNYFGNEKNDFSLFHHASDAPDIDDEKFLNDSSRNSHKIYSASQVINTVRQNEFQMQNPFAQNFGNSGSLESSNSSGFESLWHNQANTTSAPMKTSSSRTEKLTLTTQLRQGKKIIDRMPLLEKYQVQNETGDRNSDLQAASQGKPSQNWDWSQFNDQSVIDIKASQERNEQSVEVVNQVWRSQKKNNIRRSKQTGAVKHVPVNSLIQEPSGDSNSRKTSQNSMEELMNQTQKLFDWYQKQIENGTSSEEEYERSNILKFKIIEHYSKLLPWLNYKLSPQVTN